MLGKAAIIPEHDGMKHFHETLKKLLRERGVSATLVCESKGIPKSTLSEWASGRNPKLDESIVKLARFFGVSVEFLITGKHPEETVIKEMMNDLEEGFISVHKGTYRLTVEKYIGLPKK